MSKLTKDKMIDLMLLAQYLAYSDDFAAYMCGLAAERYEKDKYDTEFMNIREVLSDLSNLVKNSRQDNFNVERAYYLCKHFELMILKYKDIIKEHNLIRSPDMLSRFRKYTDNQTYVKPKSHSDLILGR